MTQERRNEIPKKSGRNSAFKHLRKQSQQYRQVLYSTRHNGFACVVAKDISFDMTNK